MSQLFEQLKLKYIEFNKLSNEMSKLNKAQLEIKLKEKFPNLIKYKDIISDAPISFLLFMESLEALPKDNKLRQQLVVEFLMSIKGWAAEFGIEFCNVRDGIKSFAINYELLGKAFADPVSVKINFWRGVYIVTSGIYVSDKRLETDWFTSAKHFYQNSISENYLVNTIPGLTFNTAGVRHDMLCAIGGTADPDFIYTDNGISYKAEFKRPTKNVEALAAYASKYPGYIYNASFLFTYDTETLQFYKISYLKDPYEIIPIGIRCNVANLEQAAT